MSSQMSCSRKRKKVVTLYFLGVTVYYLNKI